MYLTEFCSMHTMYGSSSYNQNFERERGNIKTSIHGNHVDTCVWSNDAATEGVDTCVCHRNSDYKKEALNIMNKYYNLEKRMKMIK